MDTESKQGIQGTVTALRGDFMPGVGSGGRGAAMPLAVPVHVFTGRVQPLENPNPRHPALLKIVSADRQGCFRVGLEPGVYTLVAEIDGRLYLNRFQTDPENGQAVWAAVTVPPGQWVAWNIEDNSQAVF